MVVDQRGVLEVLGPHAHDHAVAPAARARTPAAGAVTSGIGIDPIATLTRVAVEFAGEEVHRRRPDEPGHEQVVRVAVELLGRADLLQHAGAHDRDPVAERQRLGLVVGDVDGRGLEALLDPRDLGPHLHAQLGVEVRQRLVHQERARVADDRAAHRHALALTAGQVGRLAVEVLLEVEDLGRLVDLLVDLAACGTLASLSAKPMFSATVMCGYRA